MSALDETERTTLVVDDRAGSAVAVDLALVTIAGPSPAAEASPQAGPPQKGRASTKAKPRAVEGVLPLLDPYLSWAGLTGYEYLLHGKMGPIRFVLKPRDGHKCADIRRLKSEGHSKPGKKKVIIERGDAAAYKTATGHFVASICDPRSEDLDTLLKLTEFVLAEPGMRAFDAHRDQTVKPSAPDTKPDTGNSAELKTDLVIGVIDGRCGFANSRFCVSSTESQLKSRIDFFWDQTNNPTGDWKPAHRFRYGRVLTRDALDRSFGEYFSAERVRAYGTRADAEKALYRALQHDLPADADWSHGTHVLDTILSDYFGHEAVSNEAEDTKTGVIYVQLPDEALRDTSARWAASYVLDAIHYILARAHKSANVVVNLSLGAFAGPHDGSSMLERAIDRLIDDHKGRLAVVVAAGNAGRVVDDGTGQPVACHARVTLGSADGPDNFKSQHLDWLVDSADRTESFMELWIPELEIDGERASVEVSLQRVDAATGKEAGPKVVAQPGQCRSKPNKTPAGMAVINATGRFKVPNGRGGMVLVALGHTCGMDGGGASPGRWRVTVTNRSPWPITVDAWIERRDVPGDLAGYRPQYGFFPGTCGTTAKGTLGSLANGRNTIVVGAVEVGSTIDHHTGSDYSSLGVAGIFGDCNVKSVLRRGPDLLCEGEITAAGFLSGSEKTLAGTSMAAAQVTAAIGRAMRKSTKERVVPLRVWLLEELTRQQREKNEQKPSRTPAHAGPVKEKRPRRLAASSDERAAALMFLPPT
jgi:Subtilase family